MTILIIDDQWKSKVPIYKNIFPSYELEFCDGVKSALLKQFQNYDLVILDYHLDDGTAFDIADTFAPGTKYFVISGDEDISEEFATAKIKPLEYFLSVGGVYRKMKKKAEEVFNESQEGGTEKSTFD